MSHTPGPWRQGVTLSTPQTRRWTSDQRRLNDDVEALSVFAHFHEEDQGRGRVLVARFERPEDARFGAAAPDLLAALQNIERQLRLNGAAGALAAETVARLAIAKATGQ